VTFVLIVYDKCHHFWGFPISHIGLKKGKKQTSTVCFPATGLPFKIGFFVAAMLKFRGCSRLRRTSRSNTKTGVTSMMPNSPNQTQHPIPPSLPKPDPLGQVITIILIIWIGFVSVAAQVGGWLAEQIFLITGTTWPIWGWPAISGGQGLLLLSPLLPLAWFWRGPRYRTVFQTWALAAGFVLILIPLRSTSLPDVQRSLGLQTLLTLFYGGLILVVIWLHEKRRGGPFRSLHLDLAKPSLLLALLLSPLLAYPWLAWGALGSTLDTIINLVAGLLFGLLSGLILGYFLVRPLRSINTNVNVNADITLGGFVSGAALLMLASGLSVNGMQLLLMLALPPLGWTLMSLSRLGEREIEASNWPTLALLIGLTTAVPLIWIDPEELFLILGLSPGEILSWAFSAAGVCMLIGLGLGPLLFLAGSSFPLWRLRSVLVMGVIGTWSVGALVYFLIGQPGFYGDQLFVILKDQADVSAAYAIDNIDERRQFVYTTLVNHANTTQANLRAALDQRKITYRPYYLVNALQVAGGPLSRRWLEAQPEVDRVLDNPILRPLPAPIPVTAGNALPPTKPDWNLTTIRADRVWQELGITGQGIVIGQSDSGVDWQHVELHESYRGRDGQHNYNWLDPWYGTLEPTDISGHGTHTLGSIVGQSTGVAPGATWYGCANLARDLANPALYLACMQFMLAPYPLNGNAFIEGDATQSADVINNSWGCPDIEGCDPNALLAGTRALRAAGIFIVASAGNEGPACQSIRDPLALYDEAFSVGAINKNGELAAFSSRGPVTVDGSDRVKPDIVAPGVNILSAYPDNTYEYADGTSMAGPHVAGVVALVWSANPDLIGHIEQTEEILDQTAQSFNGALPSCGDPGDAVGHGSIDAYAAVQMALELKKQ
jgi:hypothetical protein